MSCVIAAPWCWLTRHGAHLKTDSADSGASGEVRPAGNTFQRAQTAVPTARSAYGFAAVTARQPDVAIAVRIHWSTSVHGFADERASDPLARCGPASARVGAAGSSSRPQSRLSAEPRSSSDDVAGVRPLRCRIRLVTSSSRTVRCLPGRVRGAVVDHEDA